MSCIRVRTTVQRGGSIAAGVQPFGGVSASVQMGGISAQVDDVHHLQSTLLENGSMRAYLVCEAGKAPYLRVSPEEPLWVSMEERGVYDVQSNTDWFIQ